MRKRLQAWIWAFSVVAVAAIAPHTPAKAADVICYNCPPQWADWASMLKAIKADLGYDIPFDNKNSGQTMSQIDRREEQARLPTSPITASISA